MSTTTEAGADTRAGYRPVLLAGALSVLVTLLVLGLTGQLGAPARGLLDPGVVVRVGLPALRAVHDGAASLTVGLLLVCAFLLPPARRSEPDRLVGTRQAVLKLAVTSAAVWLFAALGVLVLTTSDVSGIPPGGPGFTTTLLSFLTQVDLGRALGVSVLAVLVVINLAVLATRVVAVAWAAVFAVLALLPLSLAGHAGGARDHMNAVDSLALHLVGVVVWVGGLGALVLTSRRLGRDLPAVAARYSTLAGGCFALVALSGVINAGLRLGWSVTALAGGYGLLVLGKALALVLLGVAGWLHRRRTLPAIGTAPGAFRRLAAVEVLLMGATLGLAVALSRSAPPVGATESTDRYVALLSYPAPPPATPLRYLTVWYPETLWLLAAVAGAGFYLAAVVRLRRRGVTWPIGRTISWLGGCLLLAYVTSGGIAVYGMLTFSAHMLQHMALMVLVPMPLVFGAPVTLALRALRARTDGSLGPRETLLRLIHSRPLRVLGHPLVAAALFVGGLVVFYYTDLFQLALFTHTGHTLMTLHFLGTGYLFIWSLAGPDPGPSRPSYPLRMLLLLGTLAVHAFFGLSLMGSAELLAPDWWAALGRTDQAALLADQQTGGALAWGLGDIPSLLLGLALLVSWVRSDGRRTRQYDRKADRDGDADLARYNAQLAELASRSGRLRSNPDGARATETTAEAPAQDAAREAAEAGTDVRTETAAGHGGAQDGAEGRVAGPAGSDRGRR
ncbi:putative copper resistance protein D [Friedmanniella endophytica]|uniref:Putative copper resistance protein D n=1 Tax=Microlunatus kandeliicorticis TaxID=1759536 RepID=A0A7W3IQH5_9ACTN|nr:cytochrome c oxidase assembly protein [Microlunatus kandeliicorticis]MBA8793344.1 putative copper resistance protein D [Microlunatus kandeliicorticis]